MSLLPAGPVRGALGLACTVLVACAPVAAQQTAGAPFPTRQPLPPQQEIELATSAAPPAIGAASSVYVYTLAGYQRVREGTNGFTCLINRDSVLEGYQVLKPTCWDAVGSRTIVPQILHIGKRLAEGAAPERIRAELDSLFDAGALRYPDENGFAYMLQGDVVRYDTVNGRILERMFPPHVMIYANGMTRESLGMSTAAALAEPQAPLVYAPNRRFRYLVVRVPGN